MQPFAACFCNRLSHSTASLQTSIVGSVVECSPATRAARVRFPDDAVPPFCPWALLEGQKISRRVFSPAVRQSPARRKGRRGHPRGKRDANSIWCSQAVTHPSTNQTQRCLTSVIGRELVLSTWYGRCREKGPHRSLQNTLATSEKENSKRDANSIWCSQAVTHPSTNQTQRCLTSVIGRELVLSTWYGRCQGRNPAGCLLTRRKHPRAMSRLVQGGFDQPTAG